MAIERLPYEVFEMVVRCVAEDDLPSVWALAQSSRACRDKSLPTLHHTFHIKFKAIDRLKPQIQTAYEVLQEQKTFKYVRRLIVDDGLTHEVDSKLTDQALTHIPRIRLDHTTRDVYRMDPAWNCLAFLVSCLTSLEDLIFACCRPFPLSVLEALHKYRPSCRLHIKFLQWTRTAQIRGSAEYELARSPCLFSITADIETKKEIVRLILRLAPNLREVNLLRFRLLPSFRIQRAPTVNALPVWTDLVNMSPDAPPASLRSIRVDCKKITKHLIDVWQKATNLSLLEHLSLTGYFWISEFDHLTDNIRFPRLESLALDHLICHYTEVPLVRIPDRDHDQALERFLKSVPDLSKLRLGSFHWSWIEANLPIGFLQHHGFRLRELSLEWFPKKKLRVADLEMIAKSCPLLRHFGLTLRRSHGSPDEVALYKALGSMRNLQSVSLALDVSLFVNRFGDIVDEETDGEGDDDDKTDDEVGEDDETDHGQFARLMRFPEDVKAKIDALNAVPYDESFPPYPPCVSYGHLWLKLVTCACDEELARAIFKAISSGKPDGSLPLEKLTVWPTHPDGFGQGPCPYILACVLYTICRQWEVTRIVRQYGPDDLEVKESNVRNTCTQSACYEKPPELPPYLKIAWRQAWPVKCSDNWWEDWSSYPLTPLPGDDDHAYEDPSTSPYLSDSEE